MKIAHAFSSAFVVFAATVATGLGTGCGDDVALGTMNQGGSTSAGGALGSGGVVGNADAAPGVGGAQGGTGGAPDAPIGTGGTGGIGGQTSGQGGLLGTGGLPGTGGTPASGGKTGTGGDSGTGGSTAARCGTIAGLTCPAGYFCDLASQCGLISDAAGTCVLRGSSRGCPTVDAPECGCDGKTYANACERAIAGVLKRSDGSCGGGGGTTGTGGAGSGGATGAGGGTGAACGGYAGDPCPTGQFCDMTACGMLREQTGTCVPAGDVCGQIFAPVCGCDGTTYPNDCMRIQAGVYKTSDGACGGTGGASGSGGKTGAGGAAGSGGATSVDGGVANPGCPYECRTDSSGVTGWYSGSTLICAANCTNCQASCSEVGTKSEGCYAQCAPGKTGGGCSSGASSNGLIHYETCGGAYPTAYLQWAAPGGAAGTGPAVVVNAAGFAYAWTNVSGFSPDTIPSGISSTYNLTRAQTDDLFSSLAAISFSALPHPMTISFHEAYPQLYFRLCQDCTPTTLSYDSAKQLVPEMEPVWSWFDGLVGASATTNPRNWCDFSS